MVQWILLNRITDSINVLLVESNILVGSQSFPIPTVLKLISLSRITFVSPTRLYQAESSI